jgi:hypothetical protein
MKIKKILFGGMAGGIAMFFIGWLIFGVLLSKYIATNWNQHGMRTIEHVVWSSLILSNIGWGYLLATIFSWSKISNWKAGVKKGTIIGLLLSFSIALGNYALTLKYFTTWGIILDIISTWLWITIGSGIIAWVMSTVKK